MMMHRLTRKHVPLGGRQLKNPKGSEQIENNEPVERRKKQPEESGKFLAMESTEFCTGGSVLRGSGRVCGSNQRRRRLLMCRDEALFLSVLPTY